MDTPSKYRQILIVDDEDEDVLVLETALKTLGTGLSVTSVGSAEEALEQLAHRAYDLVVTDLRMPGMDGLELMRQLKELSPQTGAILVSAYVSQAVEEEVSRLQAVSILEKPFPLSEFAQCVEQALELGADRPLLSAPPSRTVAVQQTLETLRRGAGAQCALLVDQEGEVIARAGKTSQVPLEAVLVALMDEIALTARLDRQLEGRAEVSLHHYEGSGLQIYAAVDARVPFLLITLDQKAAPHRSGMAWLFLRRALHELQGMVGAGHLFPLARNTSSGNLTPAQARALGLLAEEPQAQKK